MSAKTVVGAIFLIIGIILILLVFYLFYQLALQGPWGSETYVRGTITIGLMVTFILLGICIAPGVYLLLSSKEKK